LADIPISGGFLDEPVLRAHCDDSSLNEHVCGPWITGRLIGPFRLTHRLGTGGMGEVWLAERVEGQFTQTVALKLMLPGSNTSYSRFLAERQILARLEHPGIARLYDGGVTDEGWPWMAMEYVRGHDLIRWCQTHNASLQQRLTLLLQVCDAVAYAHAHLVVHRDIKPTNIFVTDEGGVKLLDFGIAKLLSDDVTPGEATRTVQLSPNYAAPEQLEGGAITTATDVFALGVTLYKLLTNRLPWSDDATPLGGAFQRLLNENAPTASHVIDGPVPAKALRGDLDAIIGKALRKAPAARYPDARALGDDLRRYLNNEPVRARSGARSYVIRRFVRRHWLPLSAAAMTFLALTAGLSTALSQQQRAEREALRAQRETERALRIQDFLIGIFDTANPRLTQTGKAATELTAQDLLDASAERIESQFSADPEAQIALLKAMRDIHAQYRQHERAEQLQKRYVQLLLQHHKDEPARWIGAQLEGIDQLIDRLDYTQALHQLDALDASIRDAGLDQSIVRADWWNERGHALYGSSAKLPERIAAYRQAQALYARIAPKDWRNFSTVGNIAGAYYQAGDYDNAQRHFEEALSIALNLDVPETELGMFYNNLGRVAGNRGAFADADAAYTRAEQIARRTYGETQPYYWEIAANHAATVHSSGDRQRALALFEALLTLIPADSSQYEAIQAREAYAGALLAEGRAMQALEILQAIERQFQSISRYDADLPRIRQRLGEAYAYIGRTDEARRLLQAVLEQRVARNQPDNPSLMTIRQRWGRFLLARGDIAGAQTQLREVLDRDHGRNLVATALALADMARVELARGDAQAALSASTQAMQRWNNAITGARDVRQGPSIWLAHSAALNATGNKAEALKYAQQALEASQRYDDASAASIKQAQEAVEAAR
jgi:serine/threonine protein kinase